MTRRMWTDEEDRLLAEWDGKLRVTEQARRLNRPYGSVLNRRKTLGLKKSFRRVWTDEMGEKAIQLLNEGVDENEVSRRLDISPSTLRDNLIKLGLIELGPPKPPKKSEVRKKVMEDLKIGGLYVIKEDYGHTYGTQFTPDHMLENGRRIFKGKLVEMTPEFLIFDNGKFKECLCYTDVFSGQYSVREV